MSSVSASRDAVFLRAPAACGDEFEKIEWADTIAVHLDGDRYLGLRFSDARLAARVVEALGDRVHDLPDPRPYYSVKLGVAGRRTKVPLHHLYLGARAVLATRDLTRLVEGIAWHVSSHVRTATPGLVVNAVAVGSREGGVILAPQELPTMAAAVDKVLVAGGVPLADAPRAQLDLAAGTVTVPPPAVPIEVSASDLAELGSTEREDRLGAGTWPLCGWLIPTPADHSGPMRPALGVSYAVRLLDTPFPHGAQAALDGAVELAGRVPLTGVTWATDDQLVSQVLEAATSRG